MNLDLFREHIDKNVLSVSQDLIRMWITRYPIDSRKFLLDYQPPFIEDMEIIYFIGHLHWMIDSEIFLSKEPKEFDPLFKDLNDIEYHKKAILNIASRYRKDILY